MLSLGVGRRDISTQHAVIRTGLILRMCGLDGLNVRHTIQDSLSETEHIKFCFECLAFSQII